MSFDFNQSADSYDKWYHTPHGKFADKIQKKIVLKYLNKLPTNIILELGSGTGHWSEFFAEHGFFVLGIDIADKMIEIARKKSIKYASFIHGNLLELPYNNNTIENIVAITVLEFVEDQKKAFDEIFRVLKPGGGLILGVLNSKGSLAESRKDHPGFKNANFFTYDFLYDILSDIGKPEIEGGLIMSQGYDNIEIAEIEEEKSAISEKIEKGNFLVGFVIKS